MLRSLSTDTITHTTNQPDKETTSKPTLLQLYYSVCFEYNVLSNLCNDIRYDIDKHCIKQEDCEIIAHTHNISM